ncbi:MAG: helix-turn-helix transcriptional regulator [Gammaproteobacteria bacterium]|nr:helix-turn-helix transcriptional regulator [Gammaproteobacteria bacterium]
MFNKLCDNLNLLMEEAHISADELGRRTGLPSSTIKKIRNRYNPNPTLTTLLPLAKFFSITLGQLVGDEPLPTTRIKGTYKQIIEIIRHIPILSWKEVITWPDSYDQYHETITTDYEYNKYAFSLIVEEDHWENLAKGTALLIDPALKASHRDFIIIYKHGQNIASLKQLLIDEDQMYLKPVIYGYNIGVFTSEHTILGVVVEYKKNLKRNQLSKEREE